MPTYKFGTPASRSSPENGRYRLMRCGVRGQPAGAKNAVGECASIANEVAPPCWLAGVIGGHRRLADEGYAANDTAKSSGDWPRVTL